MTPSATPNLRKWYGAAAAGALAVGSTAAADAQILYTDIDDVTIMDTFVADGVNPIDGPAFDFTDNGDSELLIGEATGVYTVASFDNPDEEGDAATGFIGNVVSGYGYFLPLAAGTEIGPDSADLLTGDPSVSFTFNGTDPNSFLGAGDVFIGMQITLASGTVHYGWMRVSMPDAGGELTVKDFAVELTPEMSIIAGATGVASDPDALESGYLFSEVSPNPVAGRSTFQLSVGQAETVTAELYDTIGRRVQTLFTGALTPGTTQTVAVTASELPAGVYVVRVTGDSFVTTRNVTVVR